MRRALAAVLCAAPLAAAPARAAFTSGDVGTTAAEFLRLGAGARALGLGEAYTAAADDATALYWNPAGLARVRGGEAALMHAAYLDSTFYDDAFYAQNLGAWGAAGAGVQYFSAGSIPGTDASGVSIGSFAPSDLSASLGWAWRLRSSSPWLDGAALGAAGKYVRATIATTAQTEAADFGAQSPAWLGGRLRLGLAALNVGRDMKFDAEAEPLPTVIKLGAALRPAPNWLAAVDADAPRGGAPYAACGVEYRLPLSGGDAASGRLGYNTRAASAL
ncbi:MAG: PorV/PorQ family protein, partial [Elusimicrobia bacterium]|nr:PorV/PorQ family protein [Elusimicrobiota bacterium]